MTHPTDEELTYFHPGYKKPYPIETVLRDLAAQEGCDGEPYDAMVFAAAAIAALRAQLADARAELHGPINQLSAGDYSNVIAHLSPELEPNGELPNRNSLMMALVEASNAAKREAAPVTLADALQVSEVQALVGLMPEVIASLDATGCNVSLTSDLRAIGEGKA